ncbi:hypothetical protein N505_0111505 [Rhodococcus aetherivorans]|nr:hypothetical protein N505_0111505 [Rhodococcus aetherivorans]
MQRAPELSEFIETVRETGADRVDHPGQFRPATPTVVVGVGVDDVLVDPPRDRERPVPIVDDHASRRRRFRSLSNSCRVRAVRRTP